MERSQRFPERGGVTLLEVLAVLGVLGLLAAILLPAVQRTRATSRRLECVNNLRQLALASQKHHDAYGYLPNPGRPLYELFPYLELSAYYRPPHTSVRLRVLLCPEDTLHPSGGAPFSYLMNWGGGKRFAADELPVDLGLIRALPSEHPNIAFREITDGLSNTALYCERRADLDASFFTSEADFEAACRADPSRCIWHLADWPADNESFVTACSRPENRVSLFPGGSGDGLRVLFAFSNMGYFHFHPPNQPPCFRDGTQSSLRSATSDHVGGVNLALCDGSVRFVSNHVAIHPWWALGTRDAHDLVGEF